MSTLYLHSKNNNRIDGHLIFAFDSKKLSHDIAEDIFDKRFDYLKSILSLCNLKLDIKLKNLEPIFPYNEKIVMTVRGTFDANIISPNAPVLSQSEIESLTDIYDKIENNSNKLILKNILRIINIQTSSPPERFFYLWTAFNIIYDLLYQRGNERHGIDDFSSQLPNNNELTQLLSKHNTIISQLSRESLTNQRTHENYSTELRTAILNNNSRNIWNYTLLCIYQIRNNLFHLGIEHQYLSRVNSLLNEIWKIGILCIL